MNQRLRIPHEAEWKTIPSKIADKVIVKQWKWRERFEGNSAVMFKRLKVLPSSIVARLPDAPPEYGS